MPTIKDAFILDVATETTTGPTGADRINAAIEFKTERELADIDRISVTAPTDPAGTAPFSASFRYKLGRPKMAGAFTLTASLGGRIAGVTLPSVSVNPTEVQHQMPDPNNPQGADIEVDAHWWQWGVVSGYVGSTITAGDYTIALSAEQP